MSTDNYFDDWDYDDLDESSEKRKGHKPDRKGSDQDWDEVTPQRTGKKRSRLRDIEERLERKRLRKESTWDYD